MLKKIHFIMINVVTFVLIALLLFLPLLRVVTINGDAIDKVLFGFNILNGFSVTNVENQVVRVMNSTVFSFTPIMLLLCIFIIDKATKVPVGKSIVNFLATGFGFIYVLLLPVFSYTFVAELYVNQLDFLRSWGYYVACVIFGLVMIYYFVIAVIELVGVVKKNKSSLEATQEKIDEDKQIEN